MRSIKRQFSVAISVLLLTPDGILLLKDKTKPFPHYWKLPGGKGVASYRVPPKEIAIRKISKKTGILLAEEALHFIYGEGRLGHRGHEFHLFGARLDTTPHIIARAGKEEVALFNLQALAAMKDFFPNHRELLNTHRCRDFIEKFVNPRA